MRAKVIVLPSAKQNAAKYRKVKGFKFIWLGLRFKIHIHPFSGTLLGNGNRYMVSSEKFEKYPQVGVVYSLNEEKKTACIKTVHLIKQGMK